MHWTSALDTEKEISEAMAVPQTLIADDGREFELITWAPDAIDFENGNVVTINARIRPIKDNRQKTKLGLTREQFRQAMKDFIDDIMRVNNGD